MTYNSEMEKREARPHINSLKKGAAILTLTLSFIPCAGATGYLFDMATPGGNVTVDPSSINTPSGPEHMLVVDDYWTKNPAIGFSEYYDSKGINFTNGSIFWTKKVSFNFLRHRFDYLLWLTSDTRSKGALLFSFDNYIISINR